ncbi:ribonuclease toxin immunity protein CdiI, partial [Pseudomonas aeruginosa]
MKELFGQPYSESDPYWVVKGYFDRMYDDGYFIEAVGYIVKRWGFSTDGAYCNFPDENSPFDEEHFEGCSGLLIPDTDLGENPRRE